MTKTIEFRHGALVYSYEEQANRQGYTLGKYAGIAQNIGDGLVEAHIQRCVTDTEYDRILQRFQKKVLVKNLKKLED